MIEKDKTRTFKRKKYLLLVANLFPLFAVLFLDWSLFEVVFIYFSETSMYFLLSLVKIFYLKTSFSVKIKISILYLFVFSIFLIFVGAISFLYYFVEMEKLYPNSSIHEIINLIFSPSYFISLVFFVAVDVYYLVKNYIKKKEFLKSTHQTIIREPGLRIWILLMIALFSVFVISFQKAESIFILIIFVVLKTWIDLVVFKQKTDNLEARELFEN